jgi:peroxidase
MFQSNALVKRMSLDTMNINRGRDHGIPGYLNVREALGLSRPSSFAAFDDIDCSSIHAMKRVYDDFEDVDLFTGGVSEKTIADGVVGPTFASELNILFDT